MSKRRKLTCEKPRTDGKTCGREFSTHSSIRTECEVCSPKCMTRTEFRERADGTNKKFDEA